jgi:hypothetical protein
MQMTAMAVQIRKLARDIKLSLNHVDKKHPCCMCRMCLLYKDDKVALPAGFTALEQQ